MDTGEEDARHRRKLKQCPKILQLLSVNARCINTGVSQVRRKKWAGVDADGEMSRREGLQHGEDGNKSQRKAQTDQQTDKTKASIAKRAIQKERPEAVYPWARAQTTFSGL
jgi:hypothetical protein